MREGLSKNKLIDVYDRVAGRYDLQHAFLTAWSDWRGRRILVKEAVRPGDRVLDCGSGTGSTALLAAKKTGASGKVVLLDISASMLTVAERKSEEEGLSDRLEFRNGDLLDLPFEDDSFDVVLSTYSLCPVGDPSQGALELFRVAKPGGRIGIAHSTDPKGPFVKWLADKVENIVWRFPSISLGCRSVSVLPALEEAGGMIIFEKHIGVPLWPFVVFVVEKPQSTSDDSGRTS